MRSKKLVSQQYPLALFTTTVLITLTVQPGVAFTIKLTNPDYYVPYTVGDAEGAAWIIPPTVIKPGGTNEFKSLPAHFSRRYPGKWIFETGQELEGSFNIKDYYACGPQTDCGISSAKGGVGSNIYLQFDPKGNDPKINSANPVKLKWIQRVKSNHSLTTYIHNDIENILDINRGQTNPYYSGYEGSISTYKYFGDSPYREDALNNHSWNPELYLVEEVFIPQTRTRKVIIYNGIRWGWRNQIFRRKQPVPVPAPVPKPTPTQVPVPQEICPPPPGFFNNSGSVIIANSSSGGGGIGCVGVSPSPSPTPRPSPSPTPTPSPRPTPSRWTPTPLPTPSRWTPTPLPKPAPWASSPTPTPAPWSTATLGSTSSSTSSTSSSSSTSSTSSSTSTSSTVVVVSTSKPSAAPSPSPKPSSLNGTANANRVFATDYVESELPLSDTKLDITTANTDSDSSENIGYSSINNDATDLANISGNLLEDPELSSTDSSENQIDLASASSDLLEDPELSSTNNNENQIDLANISSDLLEDPEFSSTDSNEYELDLAGISGDLLEDPEFSSTDSNEYELDLAGISDDLLEDPELASEDNNSLASKTKNPDDDALPAEAVPEPSNGLGTLLALSGLGIFFKLKNRKNKE